MRTAIITLLIPIVLSTAAQETFKKEGTGIVTKSLSFQAIIQKGLAGGFQMRLGVEAGLMVSAHEDQNYLFPVTLGFNLFSFGLGSYNDKTSLKRSIHHDLSLTYGFLYAFDQLGRSDKPFISFAQPFNSTLVFTSKWGGGFGSRWIFGDVFSKDKKIQQVAFLNGNFGDFQMVYNNDGAPPVAGWLGDSRDRWWTAGLTFHLERDDMRYKISYARYTGYKKDAYEFATLLGYKRAHYSIEETRYNRGSWRFSAIQKNGYHNHGIAVTLADFPYLELQDIIHFLGKFAFHPTLGKKNVHIGYLYDYNYVDF